MKIFKIYAKKKIIPLCKVTGWMQLLFLNRKYKMSFHIFGKTILFISNIHYHCQTKNKVQK